MCVCVCVSVSVSLPHLRFQPTLWSAIGWVLEVVDPGFAQLKPPHLPVFPAHNNSHNAGRCTGNQHGHVEGTKGEKKGEVARRCFDAEQDGDQHLLLHLYNRTTRSHL